MANCVPATKHVQRVRKNKKQARMRAFAEGRRATRAYCTSLMGIARQSMLLGMALGGFSWGGLVTKGSARNRRAALTSTAQLRRDAPASKRRGFARLGRSRVRRGQFTPPFFLLPCPEVLYQLCSERPS